MDTIKENSKHESQNPKCLGFKHLNFKYYSKIKPPTLVGGSPKVSSKIYPEGVSGPYSRLRRQDVASLALYKSRNHQQMPVVDHSNFEFRISNLRFRKSFTLVELLIVIAIISILIGVLVPMVSRSLSGNRLSGDVEVLRAKIEETRLLAGSTQSTDNQAGGASGGANSIGYYGIYFPSQNVVESNDNYKHHQQFYALVRLSQTFANDAQGCSPNTMITNALQNSGRCLIERVDLSNGIEVVLDRTPTQQQRMIGFKVPSQQLVELYAPVGCSQSNCWTENLAGPLFDQRNGQADYLKLKYNNKTVTINIKPYSGALEVTYN